MYIPVLLPYNMYTVQSPIGLTQKTKNDLLLFAPMTMTFCAKWIWKAHVELKLNSSFHSKVNISFEVVKCQCSLNLVIGRVLYDSQCFSGMASTGLEQINGDLRTMICDKVPLEYPTLYIKAYVDTMQVNCMIKLKIAWHFYMTLRKADMKQSYGKKTHKWAGCAHAVV